MINLNQKGKNVSLKIISNRITFRNKYNSNASNIGSTMKNQVQFFQLRPDNMNTMRDLEKQEILQTMLCAPSRYPQNSENNINNTVMLIPYLYQVSPSFISKSGMREFL